MQMLKKNGKLALYIIAVLAVVGLVSGCATAKSYSISGDEAQSATLSLSTGNPSITPLEVNGHVIPVAENNTFWNPVLVPAGVALEMTARFKYRNPSTGGGLLLDLIVSAANSTRGVEKDVSFTLPALEAGQDYHLEFIKGIGVPGENKILLREKGSRTPLFEQVFE